MENILRWLKGAEIGHELYVSRNWPVSLKKFDVVNGKNVIVVTTGNGITGFDIMYDAFGKCINDNLPDLIPNISNFRWNKNWKWRTCDCKAGDVLVTSDGEMFMANGNMYKDSKFIKPCSYIAWRRNYPDSPFAFGGLSSDNRWTDEPVSLATESERSLFLGKLMESKYYEQYTKDFGLKNV